jgi:predicted dehydrogenase
MTTQDVRWLLVGTGDIANKRVAPALNAVPGSRLVSVCSRSGDRARTFAAQHGASESFERLEDALANTSANAVYIATPVNQHVPQLLQAIAAGKHVLAEKPLGLSATDAETAVQAADGKNLIAGCAYYRRCFERFKHARQMIADGRFGKVLAIRMVYHAGFNPAATDPKYWRVDPAQSGGGPLADMASHMIDILIGLFGLPASAFGNARTLIHSYAAEDTASFLLTMPDGAQVTGTFSWASDTWAHEFEIIGSKAKLRWAPCDTGKVIQTVGREITEIDLPPAANVHEPLIADFVDAVRTGRSPIVPLAEAASTNRVIDAILLSSRQNRPVSL